MGHIRQYMRTYMYMYIYIFHRSQMCMHQYVYVYYVLYCMVHQTYFVFPWHRAFAFGVRLFLPCWSGVWTIYSFLGSCAKCFWSCCGIQKRRHQTKRTVATAADRVGNQSYRKNEGCRRNLQSRVPLRFPTQAYRNPIPRKGVKAGLTVDKEMLLFAKVIGSNPGRVPWSRLQIIPANLLHLCLYKRPGNMWLCTSWQNTGRLMKQCCRRWFRRGVFVGWLISSSCESHRW